MGNSQIQRLAGKARGRSAGSAYESLIFVATVAHDRESDFRTQLSQVFTRIDEQLAALGGAKTTILSATVFLADMADKRQLDEDWIQWVGEDSENWPQRACVGATLSESTKVEIMLVAARHEVSQV